MHRRSLLLTGIALSMLATTAHAASAPWVTVWAGSVQGPYPIGNPSAQPDMSQALPVPADGARDQSFRLILRPSLWGTQARLRFSNVFGTKPLTLDSVHAGLQLGAAALAAGTNRPVTFAGKSSVVIAPGAMMWSDPVALPFVKSAADRSLDGRKLAVSFHVAGMSGPMTWHAKALQTSYISPPGSGAHGQEAGEGSYPWSTASWYFLDAVDMALPGTQAVVAFGDSITDGTASTMNGDDRWPDVLGRRLRNAQLPWSVVNAGIGGNQVVGPQTYSAEKPFPGGPSALSRLERDVIGLSGVKAVIWLEGINDFSKNGNASAEAVISGMKQGVATLRAKIPGVKIIGATVTSALNSTSAAHGTLEQDAKRKALNDFIRSGAFDGTVDFDGATLDPATGGMRAAFVPESTTGGPGDRLHPNRAGYQAMGSAFDLKFFGK